MSTPSSAEHIFIAFSPNIIVKSSSLKHSKLYQIILSSTSIFDTFS